jgi:hypothetical protein
MRSRRQPQTERVTPESVRVCRAGQSDWPTSVPSRVGVRDETPFAARTQNWSIPSPCNDAIHAAEGCGVATMTRGRPVASLETNRKAICMRSCSTSGSVVSSRTSSGVASDRLISPRKRSVHCVQNALRSCRVQISIQVSSPVGAPPQGAQRTNDATSKGVRFQCARWQQVSLKAGRHCRPKGPMVQRDQARQGRTMAG